MSETAIACLINAPAETNPLLEILWEIEQYQQQGYQPIELSEMGLDDCGEATAQIQKHSRAIEKTLDSLKRASPIAAPIAN